eukprot:2392835-Pleurochrysis_carterae.AAC.1
MPVAAAGVASATACLARASSASGSHGDAIIVLRCAPSFSSLRCAGRREESRVAAALSRSSAL